MDLPRGFPPGSGRETPTGGTASGRQSPLTGRRRWGLAVGKVESLLQVSTALDLLTVQKQRRILRDVDPWLVVERVRALCQRRPPRPHSVVLELVTCTGFLCGFVREQPLEAQFRLCQVVQFEDVGRGKLVCRQGELGDRFYMIIHGCVSVQSLNAKRQVRNLGNLSRGDYFGDIALINGQLRQATCITRSDTCLLTVGKEDFLELYKNRYSVRCVQAIKFLRKQVRPFLTISEPSLRLFAHHLCLLCFNPGTVWNVDDDGTVYFVRAGEAELLIPIEREDARFKVEGPYISVTRFKEGDYFGESSVFPEDRCGWLVRALTSMQVFSVRGKEFLKHADPTVVSTIRAESAFRVSYYAGRHNQPTPQLVDRPSTQQLRLADEQRRRTRMSVQPDGAERHPYGTERNPNVSERNEAQTVLDETQRDVGKPPTSPEKSGATWKGFGGVLTNQGLANSSTPKVRPTSPDKGGNGSTGVTVHNSGSHNGRLELPNGRKSAELTEERRARAQNVHGSGTSNVRGEQKVSSVASNRGSAQNRGRLSNGCDTSNGQKAEDKDLYGPSNQGESDAAGARAHADRGASGASAGPSGSGGQQTWGDARPRPSPGRSPLGFGSYSENLLVSQSVLQNQASMSAVLNSVRISGSEFDRGTPIGKLDTPKQPGLRAKQEMGAVLNESAEGIQRRALTCPDRVVVQPDSRGLEVSVPLLDDPPIGRKARFARALSVGACVAPDWSETPGGGLGVDAASVEQGKTVAGLQLQQSKGRVTFTTVTDITDDVTAKASSTGDVTDGAPQERTDVVSNGKGELTESDAQTQSLGGRRGRRRGRWRVRARSALSSVEVSLETARRLREQELPRDSPELRKPPSCIKHVPRRNKEFLPGADEPGNEAGADADFGNTGSSMLHLWEDDYEPSGGKARSAQRALAAADAEVAWRSALPVRASEGVGCASGSLQERRYSCQGSTVAKTGVEAKAERASRLAQVYGSQRLVRHQSSSSAAAVRTEVSALSGVGRKPGARSQSLSFSSKGAVGRRAASPGGEKFTRRKSPHLPLVHQRSGSPGHTRGTFEELTAGPLEEVTMLPLVDLSNLPTPTETILMELGPEEHRSLSLVPLPLDALTLPWQAYTIPVASSDRWVGIQTEIKRKERAKAAKLRQKTGLTDQNLTEAIDQKASKVPRLSSQKLKQSELQAVAHLRTHVVDLLGGRDLQQVQSGHKVTAGFAVY